MPKKLTEQILHDLYIVQRKSSIEISNMLNVSTTTVLRSLKKFNIKIRNASESHIGNISKKRKSLEQANNFIESLNLQNKYKIINWPNKGMEKTTFLDIERNIIFKTPYYNFEDRLKNNLNYEFYLSDKDRAKKRRQTFLKKYGVEHYSKTDEYKEKYKQTCLNRYGVENPSQTKEIKEKIQITNFEKYGFKTNLQNEDIKNKIKQTNLKKYGVENPFSNKEIQNKIKQTNLKKYGVENPTKNEDIKNKIKETNLKKYGTSHFMQSPYFKKTLRKIDGKTLKEWSKEKDTASYTTILKYEKLGIKPKETNPYCSNLEKIVEKFLIKQNLDFIHNKKLKEHKGMMSGYRRPDFIFPEYNLIIECDGEFYHDPEKDKIRNEEYRKLGYKVICFSGKNIEHTFDYVKYKIINKLKILKYFKK